MSELWGGIAGNEMRRFQIGIILIAILIFVLKCTIDAKRKGGD